ncbi:MAG TPA: cytochrome b/b6 domain-containing protein [Xanthobacteraceae bacterium]|jgi:thiosulfate reductase cytochrome b subunit
MPVVHVESNTRHGLRLHPLPVRTMHWVNAAAMIIMIMSGWKIYNDEVIFGWLHFPDAITLGTWAQHALQWHFFGMWIIALNGFAYLLYGLASGRFRSRLLPLSIRELITTMRDALTFRLRHDDLTHYNAIQKLLYLGIILVGILVVLSGLSIWKPVQLSELASLFYDFQTARLVHFLCMVAIVLFLIIHVSLSMLVPRSLLAMVTGGPIIEDDQTRLEARPSGADAS